jgi:hypothetical protein
MDLDDGVGACARVCVFIGMAGSLVVIVISAIEDICIMDRKGLKLLC